MYNLDDFDDELIGLQTYDSHHRPNFFNNTGIGTTIMYNTIFKKFVPVNKVGKNNAFIGWMLNYDNKTDMVDVLYRGFLFKEPLKFSMNLKPLFIQKNILDKFHQAKETIIANMPRIKKLKRLNLKMITKEHAITLYRYLDEYINSYEILYDYEKALILKALITTSPFYVNDNGIIKIYDMQTNELKIPDLESEAYFLAYFSFLNK